MGYSEASNGKPSRYECARGRQTKRKELQDKEDSEAKKSRIESSQAADSEGETGIAVQTDFTHHQFNELQLEINQLRGKIETLSKAKQIDNLAIEAFQGNDYLVTIYTGPPNWEVFSAVHDNLSSNSTCSPFHQLLMTLMRLCLNLSSQDLVFRFSVHMSTKLLKCCISS